METLTPAQWNALREPTPREARVARLSVRRETLIIYLMENVHEEDWHGVMDAAADLREVDAELRGLEL